MIQERSEKRMTTRGRRLTGAKRMAVVGAGLMAIGALSGCATTMDAVATPPSHSSAQAGTAASNVQTLNFGYDGSINPQTWTVPVGVTSLNITATGQGGSTDGSYAGGSGAVVTSTNVPVTPGTQLSIRAGGPQNPSTFVIGLGGFDSYVQGGGVSIDAGGGGAAGSQGNGGNAGSPTGAGLPGGGDFPGQGGSGGTGGASAPGSSSPAGGNGFAAQGAVAWAGNLSGSGGGGYGGGGSGPDGLDGVPAGSGGGGGGSIGPNSDGASTTYSLANNGGGTDHWDEGGQGSVQISFVTPPPVPPTNATANVDGNTLNASWQIPNQEVDQSSIIYGLMEVTANGTPLGNYNWAKMPSAGETSASLTTTANQPTYWAPTAYNTAANLYSAGTMFEVQPGTGGAPATIVNH